MNKAILIFLIGIFVLCSPINGNKTLKPNLKIEAQVSSSYGFCSNNENFYLVNLTIENKVDSTISFWVYTCSFDENLLTNSSTIQIWGNNCDSNYPSLISLKTGQKLHRSLIIKSKETVKINTTCKIGFIYIEKAKYNSFSGYMQLLGKERKSMQNIYWSNEFPIMNGELIRIE